jgi:hypothetical protein
MHTMWLPGLIFLMIIKIVQGQESLSGLTTNYDIFGPRMAICGNGVAVIAQNELRRFSLHNGVFSPDSSLIYPVNNRSYNQTDDFVQSVAVPKSASSIFVYIGENLDRTAQFIGLVDVNAPVELDRQQFNESYSADEYYKYCLAVDPQGLFAYVLGFNYSYIYDLNTFQLTTLWSWSWFLRQFDFVVLNDNVHGLVVGYSNDFATNLFSRTVSLILLQPPNYISTISIETILPDVSEVDMEATTYSPVNDLSITVNDLDQFIIGVPMHNVVVFGFVANGNLTLDGSNISWSAGKEILSIFSNVH